ncbi:putative Transmembrane protein 16H [Paratrimastix pyriformis]|uniref:Transmembrane protein 16H n=1 Tax=Paratrimastix pyriformis TaxID=342808 RepID=A0ABQ8UP45_9EUKA|nr:putative Transmembrane protein 16H [Paratrimastix pyriformis]
MEARPAPPLPPPPQPQLDPNSTFGIKFEGELWKKDGFWKKKWAVVSEDAILTLKKARESVTSEEVINMQQNVTVYKNMDTKDVFFVDISATDGGIVRLTFKAKSQLNRDEWYGAISHVIGGRQEALRQQREEQERISRAALRIQRQVRCHQAWAQLGALKEERARNQSASKLQGAWRRHRMRQNLATKQETDRAAKKAGRTVQRQLWEIVTEARERKLPMTQVDYVLVFPNKDPDYLDELAQQKLEEKLKKRNKGKKAAAAQAAAGPSPSPAPSTAPLTEKKEKETDPNAGKGCCGCCGGDGTDMIDPLAIRKYIIKRLNEAGMETEERFHGKDKSKIYPECVFEEGNDFVPFLVARRDEFVGIEDPAHFFFSSERKKLILSLIEGIELREGEAMGFFRKGDTVVGRAVATGVCEGVFPLHDYEHLAALRRDWVRKPFSRQPINAIRAYFGEKVGLYFTFLGFYTQWCLYSGLVGGIIFIVLEVLDSSKWYLTPLYGLFLSIWSTVFLEMWKRRQSDAAYQWGTLEFEENPSAMRVLMAPPDANLSRRPTGPAQEAPRPQYFGSLRKSPITRRLERHYSNKLRLIKLCIAWPITVILMGGVVAAEIYLQLSKEAIVAWASGDGKEISPYLGYLRFLPGVANAIAITIMDKVYNGVARVLNNWENYRTQTEYDDALMVKTFLFQFVNSYFSLFYLAFGKNPLDPDTAKGNFDALTEQMTILFLTRLIVGNITETAVPFVLPRVLGRVKGFLAARKEKKAKAAQEKARKQAIAAGLAPPPPAAGSADEVLSPVLVVTPSGAPVASSAEPPEVAQAKMPVYDTFDDYAEMVIQFGFVSLFAVAFTPAAFLAWVSNLVEIRSDAFKLCFTMVSWLSVLTNLALVLFPFRAKIFGDLPDSVEHVVVIIKLALQAFVPDMPGWVRNGKKREEFVQREAWLQVCARSKAARKEDERQKKIKEATAEAQKQPGALDLQQALADVSASPNSRRAPPAPPRSPLAGGRPSPPTRCNNGSSRAPFPHKMFVAAKDDGR